MAIVPRTPNGISMSVWGVNTGRGLTSDVVWRGCCSSETAEDLVAVLHHPPLARSPRRVDLVGAEPAHTRALLRTRRGSHEAEGKRWSRLRRSWRRRRPTLCSLRWRRSRLPKEQWMKRRRAQLASPVNTAEWLAAILSARGRCRRPAPKLP
jgi:hypothetical protein